MLEKIEVSRVRDIAWLRVIAFALILAVSNAALIAIREATLDEVVAWFFALWLGWFLLLSIYYACAIRKHGVVVFPEPIWLAWFRRTESESETIEQMHDDS